MNAAQLLREWGFTIEVVDENIISIAPASMVTDELKDWVIRNKPVLIQDILAADECDQCSTPQPNETQH